MYTHGGVRMKSVFVVDGRHSGAIPREVRNVLDLMEWKPLRPGVAYVLDWREGIRGPVPIWERIELLIRTARGVRLPHRILTVRDGERIRIGTWG